ncbi:MAG: hypothetical protein M3317_08845, partial [Actinomycetota bacterium]|nr:hypothetical protein [Actinomycetota bacterium]
VERHQIKWLLFATALAILQTIFEELVGYRWDSDILFAITIALFPVAVAVAILKYRLYDIDLIINRTLVYGSLTATLVALYFGGIVVLQRLFVVLTGQRSTLAVVASTLLIAALFNPLRHRIQDFIDRRFYRRKYDAAKTLEEFGASLRHATHLDGLTEELTGVVRETVQPAHISFWLAPAHGKEGDE